SYLSATWRSPNGDPWLCVPPSRVVCLYRGTPTNQTTIVARNLNCACAYGAPETMFSRTNGGLTSARDAQREYGIGLAACQMEGAVFSGILGSAWFGSRVE